LSLISVSECRGRNIPLPADDTLAQDIIDEQEAWLARKLHGPLTGSRTETFHTGFSRSTGKLSLARYTDAVAITDGSGAPLASDQFRLVDSGSALERLETASSLWWTGPYTSVVYEPNDEDEVRRVLFDLVALYATPASDKKAETIGAYSYSGGGVANRAASRAVLAGSLIPKRDPLVSLVAVSRRVSIEDPVINRAEPAW
jgi:hypothetical protein